MRDEYSGHVTGRRADVDHFRVQVERWCRGLENENTTVRSLFGV